MLPSVEVALVEVRAVFRVEPENLVGVLIVASHSIHPGSFLIVSVDLFCFSIVMGIVAVLNLDYFVLSGSGKKHMLTIVIDTEASYGSSLVHNDLLGVVQVDVGAIVVCEVSHDVEPVESGLSRVIVHVHNEQVVFVVVGSQVGYVCEVLSDFSNLGPQNRAVAVNLSLVSENDEKVGPIVLIVVHVIRKGHLFWDELCQHRVVDGLIYLWDIIA